ncbi:MAG TPA: hypothetical protein VKV73_00740 [Chloroflexota bacterium]|nr:hypothetical protein [Chloroflexota bacterium]
MGFLDKLFGKAPSTGDSSALAVDAAVSSLAALYDDPEVKSERGLSLTGPRASEARAVGKRLHKSGGKESMLAARDALRERHGWAVANLEAIWASLPEWRN